MKINSRARFGWFWYNDQEIFFDSEDQIREKVRHYANQGITHLILFSCTHFRWNFQPWWNQINRCIGKIVRCAHEFGMKVIEHHSSHLTYYASTPEKSSGFHIEFANRHGHLENWPGLTEFMLNPDWPYMQRRQIGMDGIPVWSPYDGFTQCFNNPDYRKEYFAYLDTIFDENVDGIMTDDVQYYGECSCPYCQKLFQEETGLSFPSFREWTKIRQNISHPVYQAMMLFRARSITNFHQAVVDHYHQSRRTLLRPNYISNALCSSTVSYCFPKLPELDICFQECCYPTIIRYCWPDYMMEELQRALIGRQRNIPHMMMFYADTPRTLLFAWGIARLCGALFTNTPEGENHTDESMIRKFEKDHQEEIFSSVPFRGIGFIDSRDNALRCGSYLNTRLFFWIQSCLFHNIPCAILDIDSPQEWQDYPVIAVNEIYMLSDKQIQNLKNYAYRGGQLIVTGPSGELNEFCKFRSAEEYEQIWGFPARPAPDFQQSLSYGNGRIFRTGCNFGFPGTQEEKKELFEQCPYRFRHDAIYEMMKRRKHIHWFWVPRSQNDPGKFLEQDMLYTQGRPYFKKTADFLKTLLRENLSIHTENFPELLLLSAFQSTRSFGIIIHFLNCGECFPTQKGIFLSHSDPIPFPPINKSSCTILINWADSFPSVSSVILYTLQNQFTPQYILQNHQLKITLPAQFLTEYAMLLIK